MELNNEESNIEKKLEKNSDEKITNSSKRTNKFLILGVFIIVLILVVFFTNGFGLFNRTSDATDNTKNYGEIEIPLSELSENAKWYEYDSDGTAVKFFAVKAKDGSVKTGFDACDVCYNRKKGYSQNGDFMICNNCGNRYPISGLGTENKNPGGCWPGYLENNINGKNVVIKEADLEKGRLMFV
ncbi:MAG: DUF2318 domain-containing protein [Candidatus Aenigmarchaeota archaeon]|nr:DUF2318 domain-containing protein [Candidatus Aenigmarchaeota archaeon]